MHLRVRVEQTVLHIGNEHRHAARQIVRVFPHANGIPSGLAGSGITLSPRNTLSTVVSAWTIRHPSKITVVSGGSKMARDTVQHGTSNTIVRGDSAALSRRQRAMRASSVSPADVY